VKLLKIALNTLKEQVPGVNIDGMHITELMLLLLCILDDWVDYDLLFFLNFISGVLFQN
jgi:hypothetical protein